VSEQEQLTVSTTVASSGVATVSIVGEIDLVTAPGFRRTVSEALDFGGPVVLDLTKVVFIDSSGLLELHRASESGNAVFVIPPGAMVARVIELGGLSEVLSIFEDVESAQRHAEAHRG